MTAELRCRLMPTFFGLTQEYKLNIHKTIFALVTHGRGGWTWSDVYALPIYLRNFYILEMNKVISAEKAEINKATQKPKKFPSKR